jgi:hypothetical protein
MLNIDYCVSVSQIQYDLLTKFQTSVQNVLYIWKNISFTICNEKSTLSKTIGKAK